MSISSTHEICKIVYVGRNVAIFFLLLYFLTHKKKFTVFSGLKINVWSPKINNSFKASTIIIPL